MSAPEWTLAPLAGAGDPWPTEAEVAGMDPPAHLVVARDGEPLALVLRDGQVMRRPGLTPEQAGELERWLATPGERVSVELGR